MTEGIDNFRTIGEIIQDLIRDLDAARPTNIIPFPLERRLEKSRERPSTDTKGPNAA